MLHHHQIRLFAVSMLALFLGACAAARPSPMSFSVRRVTVTESDRVFDQARSVLLEHGYRMEVVEPQAGRLTTHPIEIPDDQHGPVRGRSGRQVAEVRISWEQGETAIYCRVFLLRQTTEAHRLLAVEQSADDRPARTPIEGEAATVHRQNVVWETVGRNKSHERAILTDILARLGVPPTS